MTCDKCSKRTRQIVPVMAGPAPDAWSFMDDSRPIPRSALRILNPQAEAAIPWGEHPNDKHDEIGQWCPDCAGVTA